MLVEPEIALCTLVLNEMEWLPKLYEQHRHWPGLRRWIFVESADRVYAEVNPQMVNNGLSVDGTTQFLQELSQSDPCITYIPFGYSRANDSAQGKCESRTQYLRALESVRPDFLFVLDADEFYTYDAQRDINRIMANYSNRDRTGYSFPFLHPWRPPSIENRPLLEYEVIGGFWDIPHARGWRWFPGLRYRHNHNTPETSHGYPLDSHLFRSDELERHVRCVHMAFSSSLMRRHAKHTYYAKRGEAKDHRRSWYVESRSAFETWQPGDILPRDAKVVAYTGPIPECFQQSRSQETTREP